MIDKDYIKVNCSLCNIPFKTKLSFQLLIKEIEKMSVEHSHVMSYMAVELLKKLDHAPELKADSVSQTTLDKYPELVKQLMSFAFNPLQDDLELSAAWKPFEPNSEFYSTSAFKRILGEGNRIMGLAKEDEMELDDNLLLVTILYQAYFIILERYYKVDIPVDLPFTLKMTNKDTGIVKFFNKRFNSRFLEIRTTGKMKELSAEDLKVLLDNDHDLDLWNKLIPLDEFEFRGLIQFQYHDVTRDHTISKLKSDLLKKETVLSKEGYLRIKDKIRTLIENPEAEFGMAANYGFETNLNQQFIWNTIIPREELDCFSYKGTIYEKALNKKQIVLTSDIAQLEKNVLVEKLLKYGIRSHAIVPLLHEGEIMGMLEFGCKKPGSITMIQLKLLHDLFPIFALAMKRSKEDWNDMVRSVIQEEYTAIHPTVEWRFREAAAQLINNDESIDNAKNEDIVFPNVVPIYGASDIRGSSLERNEAIRADLKTQLKAAKQILENDREVADVPLMNDLRYTISRHLKTVGSGLKAGDEVVIIDFLKKEVKPVLDLFKSRYPEMGSLIAEYEALLDPELGVIYDKRKDFEDSLTLINDKVSDIIDKEQLSAQKVYPHYFEKYRTDGIEYNAYIGQSLVKDMEYSDIYLKNMRLWQLLVMVKVAREVRSLQSSLPTKLDITQLILVHSNPLSIAFRQDEKKFDVAGAYNIRYEITKKRIDKALVKGSNERITQVGKIAIVYSHADEIAEYRHFLDFMKAQGYITRKVEDLELEDLKGASGLRALRIEVDFKGADTGLLDAKAYEEVITK
ncbi:GAF domain-containing protein [Carboxylicivirga mesophila]|uniref:GAF domain-containing protein n=1 Tax=Carboxylicivirga mesophila TaxID=1166478 RepID=A0ABS5K7S9_9BACT|nr:GAF domain-containing protein [Carboxylicivirga mesophila]MBS2211056.1 GAF domain-containing protein [Carboxylicivirga mesophila]